MAGEGTPIIDQDVLWQRSGDEVTLGALTVAEGLAAYDEFTASVPQDGSIETVVDTLGSNGKPPIPEGYVDPFLDDISSEPALSPAEQ